MTITLNIFVSEYKNEVIIQGWEFPTVIVSSKTYDDAENKFKKAVETSLRANVLQLFENLQSCFVKENLTKDGQEIHENMIKLFNTLNSPASSSVAVRASLDFLFVLTQHLKSLDKDEYGKTPPAGTKQVLYT